MFKQRYWMVGVVYWLGLFATIPAAQILLDGASLGWLAVWLVGHLLADLSVSVGLHRYFSHGSFKTSRFWNLFLAFISTLIFRGPIIQWAAYHSTKHTVASKMIRPQWADSMSHLLHKVSSLSIASAHIAKLKQDVVVRCLDSTGALVAVAFAFLLYAVGDLTNTGLNPLLFAYLAPIGTRRFWDLLRELTVKVDDLAHRHGVFFTKGSVDSSEWRHLSNPNDPKIRDRWYYFDLGWYFILLTRK